VASGRTVWERQQCRKDSSVGKAHMLVLPLLQAELNVMKFQVAALCRI